jgi:hypothetical protein
MEALKSDRRAACRNKNVFQRWFSVDFSPSSVRKREK